MIDDVIEENHSIIPVVSICMITYNHEKYIKDAIESVIMQETSFPIQLVIGEDASEDDTRKICEEYQNKHPSIIKLLPKPVKNLGMMGNFVRTLRECSGKYFALCEGDDYWIDPKKLQMQYEILEKTSNFSLVYSYQYVLNNNKFNFNNNTQNGVKKTKDVLNGFIPPTRTIFFRNIKNLDTFLEGLGDQPSGDKFLAYYLSKYGDFVCLERHTAVYRVTGTGVWTSLSQKEQIIISFTHYFKFLKLIEINSWKLYFKRHLKHIHALTNWLSPMSAQELFLISIKDLYINKFQLQAVLLILLTPFFLTGTFFSIIKNRWRKIKPLKR